MQKFSDIIEKENIEIIKDFYDKYHMEKNIMINNPNNARFYWKKIIKKGNIEIVKWYYETIKQNNYFDINTTLHSRLRYINSDELMLYFYVKIIENDVNYVNMIDIVSFKQLLVKGFYETAKYILTTDFIHSENFDIDIITKLIVKYGNIDIIDFAIGSELFEIWKVMKLEDENAGTKTLIYYLLDPKAKVHDSSIERYEQVFNKLISIIDDTDFNQIIHDLSERIDFIISKHLINIFNFFISHYTSLISTDIWLENYIKALFENNTKSLELITTYIDRTTISNYTERLHNVHMDTYCISEEIMGIYYNEFKEYITSYHYFDIIVCDLPIFNPDNLSKNSKYLLEYYPDLYKDNITIDNIILYYTRYYDWDGNIIEQLIELYPDFNPIDEEHRLFKAIREINMNRVNNEEPTDMLLKHQILDYLTDTYSEHYKSIQVGDNNDSDLSDDEDENYVLNMYYLLNDENPYIPIDFSTVLKDYLDKNNINAELLKLEDLHIECLICDDTLDPELNTMRFIRCCSNNNFTQGHIYCEKCLVKWLKQECRTCPTCRNKLF